MNVMDVRLTAAMAHRIAKAVVQAELARRRGDVSAVAANHKVLGHLLQELLDAQPKKEK